jgi:phage shock protein E
VKKMMTNLALLALVLGMVAFYWTTFAGKTPGEDARRLVAAGATLVDVRTPAEFAQGHVEGALNVPLGQLEGRLSDLGERSHPVVLYCRSGNRSGQAKRLLERNGFSEVHDVGAMTRYGN